MEVNVEVVRREVIKPSSPSSNNRLQLSLLDLTSPELYVSAILFYKADELITISPETIIKNLKTSLSETLSSFYPLAGRIEGASIICNDQGVIFSEAYTNLLLQDFLKNININSLDKFSPTNASIDSPTEWPLLGVMVTFFGSGSGVAVSVSASHRICDATSLLKFLTVWANTTSKGKSTDTTIHFAETTLCPSPLSSYSQSTDNNIAWLTRKCVVNRFVFEAEKIIELKNKAASGSVLVPTRVEAISALILKCARNASKVPKSILMHHAMDLRLRTPSHVLSRDAIGNLYSPLVIKKSVKSDLEIHKTVAAFRKAKEEVNELIKENVKTSTLGEYLLEAFGNLASEIKPDVDLYTMSSWCRKPFYEVDFGWGSPVWIGSVVSNPMIVFVWLLDSKDSNDIEAWISLPEQDMPMFLRDQDLLAYAVLNPPVLT